VKNIKFGLTNPSLVSAKQKLQYAALQQSIPQGETVLTRLDAPFILDFKRNQLFLADWPGGASLPPGMPAFKGPEALANYLVSKSIRYIAYSSWSLNHPADVDTSDLDCHLGFDCNHNSLTTFGITCSNLQKLEKSSMKTEKILCWIWELSVSSNSLDDDIKEEIRYQTEQPEMSGINFSICW
jgi:hypothetical protein